MQKFNLSPWNAFTPVRRVLFVATVASALFVHVRSAGATTEYYIDAVGGNDANNGTSQTSAWRTLGKINSTAFQPGDTVLLKSGSTWNGQLWPKGSGAAGHAIRLGKYGNGS